MPTIQENIIVPGAGDLTKEVIEELRTARNLELVNASVRQRKLAQAEQVVSGGQRKNLSFGRLRMRIAPEAYHYWGGRLGYECWDDEQFLREFERDNEQARINSKSDKAMITAPGPIHDPDAKYLVKPAA